MKEITIKFKLEEKKEQELFNHLNDLVFNETSKNQIIKEWEDVSLYYTEE